MSDLVARIRARPNDAPMPTERLLDEAADEIERLRKVIQDHLDGNYTNPRSFRSQGATATCPHHRYYYEECESCNDEHLRKVLTP